MFIKLNIFYQLKVQQNHCTLLFPCSLIPLIQSIIFMKFVTNKFLLILKIRSTLGQKEHDLLHVPELTNFNFSWQR